MGKSGAERQSEETKVRLIYYIEILWERIYHRNIIYRKLTLKNNFW
jgi:hypothetical protein